jgi:hypothetical protein
MLLNNLTASDLSSLAVSSITKLVIYLEVPLVTAIPAGGGS